MTHKKSFSIRRSVYLECTSVDVFLNRYPFMSSTNNNDYDLLKTIDIDE